MFFNFSAKWKIFVKGTHVLTHGKIVKKGVTKFNDDRFAQDIKKDGSFPLATYQNQFV